MIEMIKMNLQLFADAGTLVNASGGYVNSGTGVLESSTKLSAEMKTFYDTALLVNARTDMYFTQFAKTQPLPANHGKTVEWRKWDTFEKAGVLQEGVIPTGQKFGMSAKTGVIEQYGTYASISDQLEYHAYDPIIMGAVEEMSASAAETQDTLARDGLLVNTNVLYCDNANIEDGSRVSTPVSCGEMEASETVMSMLTPMMVAKAVTILKKNKVPTINGKYYAVIHPSVTFDLRNSPGWMEAHKYASPEEIYNGEIGELHNCRFVETTNAPVLGGDDYQNKAGGVTYATYFFGKDAYGIIDPEEGGLETIIHDKSEIGGPLNQYSTVGYKLETNGATILYPERLLRVMSCSSFSAQDVEN